MHAIHAPCMHHAHASMHHACTMYAPCMHPERIPAHGWGFWAPLHNDGTGATLSRRATSSLSKDPRAPPPSPPFSQTPPPIYCTLPMRCLCTNSGKCYQPNPPQPSTYTLSTTTERKREERPGRGPKPRHGGLLRMLREVSLAVHLLTLVHCGQ